MEEEHIEALDMYFRDSRGVVVHVTGVDTNNHRVIFRRPAFFNRPGYEHGDCVCPRRDFKNKFKKVEV
ncbi:hypothetical protein D3C75_1309460 [compost metagenome]